MLHLITAPDAEPVTLEEAKQHLAVIGSADDAMLTRLITSAVQGFDGPFGRLGRALMSQTWRLDLLEFPPGIALPLAPTISVSSVKYVNGSGDLITLVDDDDYYTSGLGSAGGAVIWPRVRWPSAKSVSVEFIAGFGDAEDVPADIKNGILSVVGSAYAWRESVTFGQARLFENPDVADVIDRWRIRGFG